VTGETTSEESDVPEEKSSAQEHLEASEELAAQAKQGWHDLPESEEADDSGVTGEPIAPGPSD
jgi:hypothetical protein